MASATQKTLESHINNGDEVSREEIQSAIAKAVELRALHASLVQGSSPANLGPPSASPFSHHASHFSAQDYPLFTPSYEDEPLSRDQQIQLENQIFSESWDEYSLSNYKNANASSRKGYPYELVNLEVEPHMCPSQSKKSSFSKSRRNSLGDFRSVSSCNKCKPAILSTDEGDSTSKNSKYSNLVVPMTDSHSSLQLQQQPKNKGLNFSWLFPRLKKKHKNGNSESAEVSQILKDLGIISVETLKKELVGANERRDAALMEVTEMKSSLGELKQKLEHLETYCEELKKALRQAVQGNDFKILPNLGKPIDGNREKLMPVSEEVMVEGFLQIVSEARLSVKHFCKVLVGQIEVEGAENTLMVNLNALLQPHKLSLNSKYSKAVLYHLEAIVNQSLYMDFENCIFQKNGSPRLLDRQEDRHAKFSSFVALRNLSWNEVLSKGTKYYSEEFSKFCDQKMSCIITSLNWTRPWPEQLLQAFFVSAKCIWLVHLLAFSFNPPLGILRVEENRSFEPHYMEDMFMDKQRSQGASRVKIMVVPGFYVQERVLRCKVLCRYKSVP